MITETKTIFKCEFCRKLYQIKRFAENHEKACFKNPENDRPCIGCRHLQKKKTTVWNDTYNGESESTIELLHCNHFGTFLYPPQVEIKKNFIELDEESNNPMPKNCEIYNKEYAENDKTIFNMA